jgi:hypothetical protein
MINHYRGVPEMFTYLGAKVGSNYRDRRGLSG